MFHGCCLVWTSTHRRTRHCLSITGHIGATRKSKANDGIRPEEPEGLLIMGTRIGMAKLPRIPRGNLGHAVASTAVPL